MVGGSARASDFTEVQLHTRLVKSDIADFTYELRLETTINDQTYTVANTILSWESDPFAQLGADYSSSDFSLAAFLDKDAETVTISDESQDNPITVNAAVEFVRTNQVIDTTASEVIAGARGGDIIVMSGLGDDLVSGSLGGDRYESRLIGDAGVRGTTVINELGRSVVVQKRMQFLLRASGTLVICRSAALRLRVKVQATPLILGISSIVTIRRSIRWLVVQVMTTSLLVTSRYSTSSPLARVTSTAWKSFKLELNLKTAGGGC